VVSGRGREDPGELISAPSGDFSPDPWQLCSSSKKRGARSGLGLELLARDEGAVEAEGHPGRELDRGLSGMMLASYSRENFTILRDRRQLHPLPYMY